MQPLVHIAIGNDVIFCSPFRMAGKRGIFLAVLRPAEADLFNGLRHRSCLATLEFGSGLGSFSIRLQGSLEGISAFSPVPDGCLLTVSLPTCPRDLMQILGTSSAAAIRLGEAG